jgi:GT2 family glycosyltransferase
MLYYPSDEIQHAGVILGIGGVAQHAFKNQPRGYSGYLGRAALEQDYSCLTGACLLVRKALFNELGGFDETLPMAFNDVDFCIKIRRSDARIVWVPSVELYHHESVSIGRHDSAEHRRQFNHDVGVLRNRWKDLLESDPCYNPNLSLMNGSMFSLAWPPRIREPKDIVGALPLTGISRTSKLTFRDR